jgi:hypothetical protein
LGFKGAAVVEPWLAACRAISLGMATNRIDFDVRQIVRLVGEQPATARDRRAMEF